MNALMLGIGSALWLGLLTSISPCPLATNLAAISYVGREAGKSWGVWSSGRMYTLERVLAYTLLGALVVASVLSTPGVSARLQRNINLFLGPLLVLVGMVILEWIAPPIRAGAGLNALRDRVQKLGLPGAGLLRLLFAICFCPVSAALFFGSLIPLAISEQSPFPLPAVYGVDTGVTVLIFALILVFTRNHWGQYSRN